jgi:hypothetical protein
MHAPDDFRDIDNPELRHDVINFLDSYQEDTSMLRRDTTSPQEVKRECNTSDAIRIRRRYISFSKISY